MLQGFNINYWYMNRGLVASFQALEVYYGDLVPKCGWIYISPVTHTILLEGEHTKSSDRDFEHSTH